MATDVDICNLALSRVRAGEIGSLSENSAEAIQCRILFPMMREQLITSFAWPFAKVTRALSLSSFVPEEWDYAYDYPNDCLRIHYVLDKDVDRNLVNISSQLRFPNVKIPYEVGSGSNGSRLIFCNLDSPVISYTKNIEDTRLFDPLFTNMLAWHLAAELAIPLGGDSGQSYRNTALQALTFARSEAMALAANERERGGRQVPESIRQYGSGYVYENDKPLQE